MGQSHRKHRIGDLLFCLNYVIKEARYTICAGQHRYPQKQLSEMEDDYDYIISGCLDNDNNAPANGFGETPLWRRALESETTISMTIHFKWTL